MSEVKIEMVYDIICDESGKTWKEKNAELEHNIPIGTLVEIDAVDHPSHGVRLRVCSYLRDCDNTPLYELTCNIDEYERFKSLPFAVYSTGGWNEDSLIVVDELNKK